MYTSLNDAAKLNPFYAPGNIQIWFCKPETDRDLRWDVNFAMEKGVVVDADNLNKTHTLVGSIAGSNNKNEIFPMMQGESWSPEGEARNLIRSLGLQHTSMSVGDILVLDGVEWIIASLGFKKVREVWKSVAATSTEQVCDIHAIAGLMLNLTDNENIDSHVIDMTKQAGGPVIKNPTEIKTTLHINNDNPNMGKVYMQHSFRFQEADGKANSGVLKVWYKNNEAKAHYG